MTPPLSSVPNNKEYITEIHQQKENAEKWIKCSKWKYSMCDKICRKDATKLEEKGNEVSGGHSV